MKANNKRFAVTRSATAFVACAALSMSLSVQAEPMARYLVQYHSTAVIKDAQLKLSTTLNSNQARGIQPLIRIMNQNLRVQSALRNSRMLEIIATSEEAAALARDPNVALVEKEYFFPAPQPMSTKSASRTQITANELPNTTELVNEGEITWGLKAVRAVEAWKVTQGGDQSSLAGRNSRVLVLDTGIDRDHFEVKSRFEAGRNFLGKMAPAAVNALDALLPSLDGGAEGSATYDYFDDNGHGTHVAGTILGAYNGAGVAGVAPLAHLLSGRVCGKFGCSSVGIIRGIEYGIEQKVDVINMSLGGPVASMAGREAVAAADRSNVVVVAASGNDGHGIVSFPAAYEHSLAVGAIDSALKKANFSNWGPELDIAAPGVDVLSSVPTGSGRQAKVEMVLPFEGEVKSMSFVGAEENELPLSADLVFVGLGKTEDFEGKDLRGKFALIQRGEIPFADKVKSAIAANAVGVLIFNNEAGLISGALTQDGTTVGIPVAMIEKSVGDAVVVSLNAGDVARASISVVRTNYSAFNGTSMASPHVAGVAALVKSANKALTAAQVRQILVETTNKLEETPDAPNGFGSGLVNAQAAVEKAISLR